MRKKRMIIVVACTVSVFSLGVYAAPAIENITAGIRPDVKVTLNGVSQNFTDSNGNVVYPVEINESIYLPIRGIGETMGMDVKWDENNKNVILTSKQTGEKNLPSTQTPSTQDKKIKEFDQKVGLLIDEVNQLVPGSTYEDRMKQYKQLDGKIEALDNEVDQYDDTLEWDYKAGKMTVNEYNELDKALDLVDDKISNLDDLLESKLGIDD